jgi:hypothetical protein
MQRGPDFAVMLQSVSQDGKVMQWNININIFIIFGINKTVFSIISGQKKSYTD